MIRIIFLIIFASSSMLSAQTSFGQNKVQYRDFDWNYISSPQFDIYYYGEEIELAHFTMAAAGEAYEQIAKHLRWNLKKRVPIIVYHSHNEFQQTNVIAQYMQEGIGGVTELFKNRIVIPFEGDYAAFRHVIHHELVHAMINDLVYGGRMQNVISGQIRLQIPLWANEGLAEYLSSNWDTQADMTIRDLAINERIPTIRELEYFLAYKGGQSVWRFIAAKYGREKIGEVFQAMKLRGTAEAGFKEALGMDFEELTEQWHKYIKKEYYPDVAGRDEVNDIAKRLTDHKKSKNFYNVSPTISPDGSKIAVLSDRSGYMDIYILDVVTGKKIKRLIKGNRSINFEELKFLQPGISWSPDSKKIALAAKSGAHDALYLIDVDKGKQKKIIFELDGVFTASWSPDGKQLAFVGNEGGASDIYIYNLDNEKQINITDDIFSDTEPSWSPDGKMIAFVSDRGGLSNNGKTTAKDMINHKYDQKDIYTIDVLSGNVSRITETDYNENYPIFAHTDNKLFYTADYQGTWNLFRHDFNTNESQAVTNLLTGLFQLSLTQDDATMVFTGYSGLGWDVYRMNNPLSLDSTELSPTNFILNQEENDKEELVDLRKHKRRGSDANTTDYATYIFAWEFEHYNNDQSLDNKPLESKPDSAYKKDNGEYIPQVYKTLFSLDVAQGQYGYNNVFGHQGLIVMYWSDMMGDHQISAAMQSQISLSNSDYYLNYGYLKKRTDYYFTLFHQADFFFAGYSINEINTLTELTARMRHFGFAAMVSRPFNRFHRIDAGVIIHNLEYKLFEIDPLLNQNNIVQDDGFISANPTVSYVFDNTVFGYTGPVDGFRQNTTIEFSPAMGNKGISYQKIKIDMRKYHMVTRDYSFAGRIYFGASTGKNPQKYFLGGMQNWLLGTGTTDGVRDDETGESRWRNVILDSQNNTLLQDIYFSEFAYPLRGARFSERFGTNVFLANFEFRFPFIQYFQLGFPKILLGNIRGHIFMDIGAAWDDPREFTDFPYLQTKYGNNLPDKFSPWVKSIGYGIKLPVLMLFRIEAAYDWTDSGFSKPQWYLSIGYDW